MVAAECGKTLLAFFLSRMIWEGGWKQKPHELCLVIMMKRVIASALAALFFLCGVSAAYPPVYTGKLRGTPDLCQADKAARLPKDGKGFCAPVAVSNSLVWLARNGYPDLLPKTGSRRMTQPQLAMLLGKPGYMDTSDDLGTSPTDLLTGISRFLGETGYDYEYLAYQGWRNHPAAMSGNREKPDIDWIKDGLVGDSAVWLNVGWYAYDPMTEIYERKGGHWVTLVGYGVDRKGRANPEILIIHDPSTRSGRPRPKPGNAPELQKEAQKRQLGFFAASSEAGATTTAAGQKRHLPALPVRHDFVRIVPMSHGTMRSRELKMERSVSGYYRITGITSLEKGADIALLDGAVVLRMQKRQKVEMPPLPPSA